MATGLTYTTYQQQLAIMAGYTVGTDGSTINYDPNFLAILPQTINYAELRIQRDLDFLASQTSNTAPVTAGDNSVSIPLSTFITIQTVEVIDLSNNSSALLPVGKEYIQNVYGGNSTQNLPQFFAMYGSNTTTSAANPSNLLLLLGPTPDKAYTLRLTGTIHFQPLSQANPQTLISTFFPDLFLMASMIYISGFQRNFGRQSDDPSMAQSYESQYKALLAGSMTEEARKKFEASAWTAYSAPVAATPTRG